MVVDLHSVRAITWYENALIVQSLVLLRQNEYFSICKLVDVSPGANHLYLSSIFTEWE